MDRGRIVQMGSPQEIYARPANGYAADFLGSANLIPAADGKWRVVRREEIEILVGSPSHLGEGRAGGHVVGVIEGVEFRGSITGYRIRTEFGVVHVDTWSVQHGRTHERGEEVVLRIPAQARVVEK